jgi:hypothetical protein
VAAFVAAVSRTISIIAALAAALLLAGGCGQDPPGADLSSAEKLGYVARSDSAGTIMLTTVDGGEGESLLDWKGYGERFSFSPDGRFFTVVFSDHAPGASRAPGRFHNLVAATDGKNARAFSGGLTLLAFSPDSSRVAYSTFPVGGANEIGVMNPDGSGRKTLARGSVLVDPTWADNKTIVYTEIKTASYPSRADGGTVYRVDTEAGFPEALTPAGRAFSTYNAPVSFIQPKIILTEKGPLHDLFSLDVAGGSLKQITNNTLYQFRAGYLPGTDTVLFEEQKSAEDQASSEICTIADDGSDFRMLTRNFYFDGVHSFSAESGRVAWQRKLDTGETSIWTIDPDAGDEKLAAGAAAGLWLGDPNFAPVPAWERNNPLRLEVKEGTPSSPMVITVTNASADAVETELRAFAGLDLVLEPSGEPTPGAGDEAENQPKFVWKLSMAAGEKVDIRLQASPRPTVARASEATLLLTLTAPDAPPRMFWQDLG